MRDIYSIWQIKNSFLQTYRHIAVQFKIPFVYNQTESRFSILNILDENGFIIDFNNGNYDFDLNVNYHNNSMSMLGIANITAICEDKLISYV